MGSDMAPKLPGTREGGRGKGEGEASGRNAEQLSGFTHRGNERVDVVHVVVDVERCARCRRHAEPPHQRLRAVMPGADADAVAVEDRGEVVGMDVAVREWHDAGTMVLGAV